MNRRSVHVTCRQRIVELTHPQGTPLDIVLSLGPGMSITESTVFRADLQAARYPASAPLARTADVTAAPGATGPWTLPLSGAQLNQTVTGESRRFWLPVYGIVGGTRVEPLVGIVITLTANNISSLAPPPPVEPIYLTEASASDLYAALADFENLVDRVEELETTEGGGAQADWNAVSGPSVILNKPSLGNSASRNVGTGAGDVAAGNHNHSSTSQIAGLDTALAGKADLLDGKIPVSQIPSIALSEFLGMVGSQAAMLALVGQRGDWCGRTDLGKVYVVTAEPSSLIANWVEWIYPVSPVMSVAGRTGTITLGIGDIANLQDALDTKVNSDALFALAFRDTVGSAQIDAGAVTESKIADGAVTAAKLAPGAVPPAGSGTELQFRNLTSFGAVSGSSVSGSVVTLGELRVNPGDATQGFRVTSAANVTSLFLLGGNTNGQIYAQGNTSTASTATTVAVRAAFFRVEGIGGADASAALQIGTVVRVQLRPRALNNLALGPADAVLPAAPTPQTISVQNATGLNASAAAAVLTIDCAQGTGTAVGGDGCVRVSPPTSTGSTPNPLVDVMRWRAVDRATVCSGAIIAGGPVVLASYTVSTVPSATLWPRGQIWVSDESGGPTPSFSDGTNWRRYADRAVLALA